MIERLAPVHLAVSLGLLIWNIFMAGQIARSRVASRPFAGLTALAGLLIAPAAVTAVAASTILTGRAVVAIGWVWAATTLLFAAQALYATTKGLVTSFIGVPILLYNVFIFAAALTRYMISREATPPPFALSLTAAHATALGAVMGAQSLYSPFAVQLPLLAPAFAARWRGSVTIRSALALLAGAWVAVTLYELPQGVRAVRSYERFTDDRLQERPAGDFAVGLRILPDVDAAPSPVALRNDLGLADTLDVDAVHLVIEPEGTTYAALDSLRRSLEQLRRVDSVMLIVSLGYPQDAAERFRASPEAYTRERMRNVDRIARALVPDILLPAMEPYGRGARQIGRQPVGYWREYLTRAAAVRDRVNRRIRIGVAASLYDARDSALYAWAASPDSPVDVVGFTFFPSFRGAPSLDARMQAADRWLRAVPAGPRRKPHWVFAAGAFPLAHGERSQERAIRGTLAWATSRAEVKGLVVADAGDYQRLTGLRAAGGRLRPAVVEVARAIRGLRETTTAGQ